MSKDNLILFPNKSKPNISMTNAEVKWMVSGSLVVILMMALGVNSTLFAQKQSSSRNIAGESITSSRSIASINPIFRVSWEKKAFQVLEKTNERDLANVGTSPSLHDNFTFGALEGKYKVRQVDGVISEIQLSQDSLETPKILLQRESFLNDHISLFSNEAHRAHKIHVEDNDERLIEKFKLVNDQGQDIGRVQVLLDKNQKLLSMTVQ